MKKHCVGAALLLLLTTATAAQEDEGDVREVRPGIYVGMSSCANGLCHGSPEPLAETAVLQNEYPTWLAGDPHRRAYETLSSPESRAIAETLEPGRRATQMPACLACHSIDVPAARRDGLYLDDGISCEGCHGPAGGWRDRHFEEGWERSRSIAAGMLDLRDLEARAELCLSCHLGSDEAVVDHRLIAAGHPRLAFELDNYTASLPRHWRLDREREGRPPSHGLPAWAAGQAAGFQAGLGQLARQAAGDGPWPPFAELECQGCHHSLEDAAWRRQPGYRFRDGLPQWSPARWAVLRHLLTGVEGVDGDHLDTLAGEIAQRLASMSEKKRLATRARELARALDGAAGRLADQRWREKRARALLADLAADRERLAADLATAEQTAWALQSLAAYLVEGGHLRPRSPAVTAVDAVFAELQDPGRYDRARFIAALERLEQALR